MASSNWVPEAEAMDSGFALDNLLRTQRSENARQAQSLVAGAQQTNQQYQNKLGEMLYGDKLKQQAADREAERSAPFLKNMIYGNPEVAKAFGYTPGTPDTIQRTGAMAEPEAAGIQAPITPGTPARMPTTQDVAGLAKAVPGITQAVLQRQLEQNKGPLVVPRGAGVFDPKSQQWLAEPQESGTFATPDEALRDRQRMEQQYPEIKGRSQTIQDPTTGRWRNQFGTTEPLTPQDPNLLYADALIKGADSKVLEHLKTVRDDYNKAKAVQAGQVAFYQGMGRPPSEQERENENRYFQGLSAVERVQSLDPVTRKAFVGLANKPISEVRAAAGSVAQTFGLPWFKGEDDFAERYSTFKSDLSQVRKLAFIEGGKQLTGIELNVATGWLPTGQEKSAAEFEAKLKTVRQIMEVNNAFRSELRRTPTGQITPEFEKNLYHSLLQQAGIDVTKKDYWMEKMTPDERLRYKMGK